MGRKYFTRTDKEEQEARRFTPPPSKANNPDIRLIFNPEQPIPDWKLDPDVCITPGGTTVIATNLTEEHLAAFIFWMNIPFQCVENSAGVTWPFISPSLKTMQELYMQFLGAFIKPSP